MKKDGIGGSKFVTKYKDDNPQIKALLSSNDVWAVIYLKFGNITAEIKGNFIQILQLLFFKVTPPPQKKRNTKQKVFTHLQYQCIIEKIILFLKIKYPKTNINFTFEYRVCFL